MSDPETEVAAVTLSQMGLSGGPREGKGTGMIRTAVPFASQIGAGRWHLHQRQMLAALWKNH